MQPAAYYAVAIATIIRYNGATDRMQYNYYECTERVRHTAVPAVRPPGMHAVNRHVSVTNHAYIIIATVVMCMYVGEHVCMLSLLCNPSCC